MTHSNRQNCDVLRSTSSTPQNSSSFQAPSSEILATFPQPSAQWDDGSPSCNEISEHQPHYYFGYGAMCNPVSRQRRNIDGKNFRAAVLPNFRLDFSNSGVASVVEVKSEAAESACDSGDSSESTIEIEGGSFENCVHGVLMEFHERIMWEKTVASEKGYEHRKVWVYPYADECSTEMDDTVESRHRKRPEPVLAHIFYMTSRPEKSGRPQERYLKIIAQGLEHHGVTAKYIQKKILSVESIPCRAPSEFRSFPSNPEPLPTISFEEYQARSIATNPCFVLADKVVDLVGALPDEDQALMKFLRSHAFGEGDLTPFLRDLFYDPDMSCYTWNDDSSSSDDKLKHDSNIWNRWAENQMVDIFASCHAEGRVTMRLAKKQTKDNLR
ncbi:hypothetical protein IV203_022549 [Nitzschia inconspicua]|uniref:gamma-glutamylcyclotransferase n=1 Tax=Nitzschia inconspicua TaxID=303405 RepID=A0A9K3KJF6_9STRA|nr:hypothetical protein IV203_022549 [Nitzschia inconspicua]